MNRVKAAVSAARFQGNMVAKHYYYTSLRGRNGLVLYVTIHAAPENGNAHSQVAPDAQKSLRLTGGSCNHRRLCPKSTDAFRPIRCQFRRKIEIGEMGRQHRLCVNGHSETLKETPTQTDLASAARLREKFVSLLTMPSRRW